MLKYFKTPSLLHEETTLKLISADFIKAYLSLMLISIVFIFLNFLIDRHIVMKFYGFSILDQAARNFDMFSNRSGFFGLIILMFLAPLVEELTYRLLLRPTNFGFAFSACFIAYRVLWGNLFATNFNEVLSYVKWVPSLIIFILCFRYLSGFWQSYLDSKFRSIYILSALCFALGHILIYRPLDVALSFFYILILVPHFFSGLCIGYFRIRYGFAYGLLFHILLNIPLAYARYF
jgi:hypothetical protein